MGSYVCKTQVYRFNDRFPEGTKPPTSNGHTQGENQFRGGQEAITKRTKDLRQVVCQRRVEAENWVAITQSQIRYPTRIWNPLAKNPIKLEDPIQMKKSISGEDIAWVKKPCNHYQCDNRDGEQTGILAHPTRHFPWQPTAVELHPHLFGCQLVPLCHSMKCAEATKASISNNILFDHPHLSQQEPISQAIPPRGNHGQPLPR